LSIEKKQGHGQSLFRNAKRGFLWFWGGGFGGFLLLKARSVPFFTSFFKT
jgi:hypothetical protein